MSNRKASAAVAGVLIVIGVVVGLWPHRVADRDASSTSATVDCGAAFAPDSTASEIAQLTNGIAASNGYDGTLLVDPAQACADSLKAPRISALTLVGVGAIGLLFLLLTTNWSTVKTRWSDDAEDEARRAAREAERGGRGA